MKIRLGSFSGIWLVTLLGLVLAFQLGAQKKAEKAPKMSNVQGSVQMIDKAKMTITVVNGNVKKEVIYSADTKFMVGHSNDNKPGSVADVKDSFYISCSGTFPDKSVTLKATTCVYRATK